MSDPIDFAGINAAALGNGRALAQQLVPGGAFRSHEYVVRNPARDDKNPGSFTINCRTGRWSDFAIGAKGGDFISWYAHARNVDQSEAARQIAKKLGIPLYKNNGGGVGAPAKSPQAQSWERANDIFVWGGDGPPRQHAEIRRHYYPIDRLPKQKVKIKSKSELKDTWVAWYRVFRNGVAIGWQAKKPDDYIAMPYVTVALDPFDSELKADEILWPEGERDVDTLNKLNLPAFTFGGVGDGLPYGIGHYLKDRRLVILADNDDKGRGHAEKKAARAHEAGAASIKIVHFPELPPKEDYFIANGVTVEQLTARIDAAPIWSPAQDKIAPKVPSQDWRARIVMANDLQAMTFSPVRFIVPGYIPEGVTIIAGKPKVGKSWLTLDLALGATADRFTLGTLKPAQGDVLYLALEDNKRRLKRRMGKIWPHTEAVWPKRLAFAHEWKRADQGGLDDIEEWCRSVPNPVMVVIDTLEKFRPLQNGKEAAYSADYRAVADLQKVASQYGIAIIVNHHVRKMDADDPFDTVSGTLGLTGAADTIIVLKRHAGAVTLHARGRDIEEAETALQFERATCRWTILGAAAEVYISNERGAVLSALAGAGEDGLAVSDIMAATGRKSRSAMDTLLFKMKESGEIVRIKRGTYALPEDGGKIGQNERIENQGSENTGLNGHLSNLGDLTGSVSLGDKRDGASTRETEDAPQENRAPSGVDGTLGDDIDTSAAGSAPGSENPHAAFRSPKPEDDLNSIPGFLLRANNGSWDWP